MSGTPDAQYRWFVGLSDREALSEAVDRLQRSTAFLVEHWGVVDVPSGDRELGSRLEIGDRAFGDAVRENHGTRLERADHVVERALRARPLPFLDFVDPGRRRPRRRAQ